MSKRPNILLITSDQQRKDSLSVYNPRVSTPVLEGLACEGIVMDRSYITHPTCTPSRASILTGQLASRHGAYTIGTALDEGAVKFSDILSENGYETYFVGKPHFQQLSDEKSPEWSGNAKNEAYWEKDQGGYFGFDHTKIYNGHTSYSFTAGMHYRLWLKEKGLGTEEIEERFDYKPSDVYREHGNWKIEREYHPTVFTSECAAAYLENREKKKPFLMWVSFSDPHDPHVVPEPYDTMYSKDDVDYLGYVEGEHDNRPKCYKQLYEKGVDGLEFNDAFGVPSALSAKLSGDDRYFREVTAVHHGMVKLMDEEIGKIIRILKETGEYDNTLILFTTDHGDYLGNHGFLYKGFPAFEEVYNVPMIVKLPDGRCGGRRMGALVSHIDIAPTILEAAGIEPCGEMDGVSQWKLWNQETEEKREYVMVENRPVTRGFYQKMIITEQYKLVVYMDSEDGELYDLKNDRNQYRNLWDEKEYGTLKETLLRKIAGREETEEETCGELLQRIWKTMQEEEPVQERTSYS